MNLPVDKSERFKSPSGNVATVMIYGGTNVMIYGTGVEVGVCDLGRSHGRWD